MKSKWTTEPTLLREQFLANYLFADVLFSPYCTQLEMRSIYDQYANVFCLHNEAWLRDIWEIVSSELFCSSDNITDFNRLVRLAKQYPDKVSELENYVLSLKADAVQIKAEILRTNEDASFETMLQILDRKAIGGDIDCISLLAFLEYHGFLVNQDRNAAQKKLKSAASWNHMFAILMGARYSDSVEFFHKKLCALLNEPSTETVWEYLKAELEIPHDTTADKVALALDYALCHDAFQPRKIHAEIMKLMKSSVLHENSKYKLIKAANEKNSLSSEIPLAITRDTELTVDFSVFDLSSAERQTELDQVRSNLSMLDLRDTSVYKPLLFVCDDELVLNYYRESIKSCFAEAPISHVHLHAGEPCRLSHIHDNMFIASMERHGEKNVVLMIDHCEVLNAEGSTELAKYLKASNRKHYKLGTTPQIEMDLSGVLPILFSTTVPDPCIAGCCDVVLAMELTPTEFHHVLEKTLEQKRTTFKLSSISMDAAVSKFLFEYSSATVTSLLNKAIGQLRRTSRDVHISVDVLKNVIEQFYSSQNKNGFWRNSAL